ACRGLVSDNENDQSATKEAFEVLHFIAAKRLAAGRLTVVDATNVQPEARKPLVALAREFHVLPVAIVLDVPERVAHERNRGRADRDFGPHVIRQQASQLHKALRGLDREGFRRVHVLRNDEEIAAAEIVREKLWNDRRDDHGPFDIIGDVHGCFDELCELLAKLGYTPQPGGAWAHPAGRRMIFLGDLVDRGPKSPEVVRLVIESVKAGSALALPGNHDMKFMRKIWGKNVQITHGLAESLAQFEAYEQHYRGFSRVAAEFFDDLVSHYVLDDGRLVVAHAGLKETMQGRGSGAVREFCLYGETTGETDEFGLPVRYPWAQDYRGAAMVVYGHTPVPEPEWLNRTINIDTGCVFGGRLTALRYPEKELASVPARATYAVPARPFLAETPALSAQQAHDDLLDIADVSGKRIIGTRLHHNITIRQENATAALEVMSRFAANPKWLIYLPPTMSPSGTSALPGLLEYPAEAFDYYRREGVPRVICQEKHMGSRAVVIVCRDVDAARERFGVEGESGIVVTRTGRRFFEDAAMESALLDRVRVAIGAAGLWDELQTTWLCLDCELMPWSAKAQALIRDQYAAVGAAATSALADETASLEAAAAHGVDVTTWLDDTRERERMAADYIAAYRRYCWPVNSIEDLRLAPFHLLASEKAVHVEKDHEWHMRTLARFANVFGETPILPGNGSVIIPTLHHIVDLLDPSSETAATAWWQELTARGGEGMVVKPLDFIARGSRGILQPAVKCRGREYLRIIYGPEYTAPQNLDRLRKRGLAGKRSLALREFALGIEALERFVRREPLRRVHECVFGVLALESEPVDPRL
ncbi:MAG TPA: polynucleotide kinase-phosphatase, partial [Chthoniobacteraceae bacterium]|nr:polynucleotide kinase-phosphatase [Chthoniobacteraceae bacterium]